MKAWLQLIKYKLSLAVTITGLSLYLIQAGKIDPGLALTAFGIFLLASGASILNQYQEKEYDSLMERTSNRPLPSGTISPLNAYFASALMILAGSFFLLFLSTVAAILGLINILLYNLVYTRLKRISYLAIIPGALVGALPPLIGWFAAGATELRAPVVFLSVLMFMWQVPHFWILVIKYNEDYQKAGFKSILSIMNQGQVRRVVSAWIILGTLLALSFPFFDLNPVTAIKWILLALCFVFIIMCNLSIFKRKTLTRAFILSNIFIVLFFALMALGYLL